MNDLAITINNNEYIVKFDKKEESIIFLNDNTYNIELLKQLGNNVFSFSVNNRIVQVELELRDNGPSYINSDGFSFEIDITDETKKLIKKFLGQTDGADSKNFAIVKAPMPGMVIKILVNEGDSVNKGDKIMIIEAMKMENSITSPINGVVTSIKVSETKAVEKDTVLMEIQNVSNG